MAERDSVSVSIVRTEVANQLKRIGKSKRASEYVSVHVINACELLAELDESRNSHIREAQRGQVAEARLETTAALEAERDALRAVIAWALGERDDFPDRPERVEGKPYPFYYWRSELRKRADAVHAVSP